MTRRLRIRIVATAIALGLALGLGGPAMRPAPVAAIDPCFGYDLCVHLSVTAMGRPSEFGDGRVTSSPSGIDCQFSVGAPLTATSTCDHYFHANFVSSISVTLTATANSGSLVICDIHVFDGVASCTWDLQYTSSVTTSKSFDFSKAPVSVNVGNAGKPGGFVYSTPNGIDCGEQYTPCSAQWPFGTNIVLTAEGDVADFLGWTGYCAGNDQTCEIGLETTVNTTAIFGTLPTPTPKPTPKSTPGPGATHSPSPGSSPTTRPGATPHVTGAPPMTEPTAGSGTSAPVDSGIGGSSAGPTDVLGTSGPASSLAGTAGSSSTVDQGVPTSANTTFDVMPIVIAIIVGFGLFAIGVVIAAAMLRRGRGAPR